MLCFSNGLGPPRSRRCLRAQRCTRFILTASRPYTPRLRFLPVVLDLQVVASFLGVGAPEAFLVGVVALVVFGPQGLAEVRSSSDCVPGRLRTLRWPLSSPLCVHAVSARYSCTEAELRFRQDCDLAALCDLELL